MATKAGKLTPKQEAFCREYLIDLNGTQAAIRAGYSKKTAREMAVENLSKPPIAKKLAELQAKIAAKTELSAEYVLNGLLENHRMATLEKKFSDSNKALELLGKHLSLFTEKVDHTHSAPDGGPITFRILPVSVKRA